MKSRIEIWLVVMASSLALCLGTISCGNSKGTNETTTADASTKVPTQTTQTQPDLEKQRQQAEQQARPGVEKERKQAEEEATKNLDQDAIAAITDTQAAIDAIASNKSDAALKAIEQATGKINVLLARNPRAAFIPVSVQVVVIDSGPHDLMAIKALTDEVSAAVSAKTTPRRALCSTG